MVDITPDVAPVISHDGQLFALIDGLQIPVKLSSEARAAVNRQTREQLRRELRNVSRSVLDIRM